MSRVDDEVGKPSTQLLPAASDDVEACDGDAKAHSNNERVRSRIKNRGHRPPSGGHNSPRDVAHATLNKNVVAKLNPREQRSEIASIRMK